MNEIACDRVAGRLPEHVAGRLSPAESRALEHHLETCPECRAQAELLVLLRRSRPSVPAGLADRIRDTVGARRRAGTHHPWWALAAAAVAVLAIGVGVVAVRREPGPQPLPAYAADSGTGTSDVWLSDGGLVAGAPVLGGLSDQALEQLLKEMGQWKQGA